MASSASSGQGSGGSSFDAGSGHFPSVPYGSGDFNGCGGECTPSCEIKDYGDKDSVQKLPIRSAVDLTETPMQS